MTGGQGRTSGGSGESRRPVGETRSSAGRDGKNDAHREGRMKACETAAGLLGRTSQWVGQTSGGTVWFCQQRWPDGGGS